MQKFFSNKKLIALMIALLVSLGLIAGSMYASNNRNTPPFLGTLLGMAWMTSTIFWIPFRRING